jgi:hypothetical protein
MPRVERLKQVECLATSHFADDNAIGPMTKGGAEEISDRDRRQMRLFTASLKANEISAVKLQLGGVLNQNHAIARRQECREGVQERRLARARPADQDVYVPGDGSAHDGQCVRGQRTDSDEFVRGQEPGLKLSDRQSGSAEAARRKDRGNAQPSGSRESRIGCSSDTSSPSARTMFFTATPYCVLCLPRIPRVHTKAIPTNVHRLERLQLEDAWPILSKLVLETSAAEAIDAGGALSHDRWLSI